MRRGKMDVINLKYGCNPHQKNAKIYANKLPIKILNGNPDRKSVV